MGATFKKYIWILGLLCVIIISYFLAKIVALYIEGYFPNVVLTSSSSTIASSDLKKSTQSSVDINVILKRNFFDAQETSADTVTDETTDSQDSQQTISSDEAVETRLSLKLVSTISVGDGMNEFSSCVIESNRQMDTYFVDDKKFFAPNTKIVKILPRRVEFLNNGQLEFVKLQEFAQGADLTQKPNYKDSDLIKPASKNTETVLTDETIIQEGNNFQIARSEVDAALTNMSKLYTDIRGVPNFQEGVAKGFKILSVRTGSLFDKLGIKRGDILKSVNGRTLDIQSGFETFKSLKSESEFVLEVERRGEDLTYKYEII